MSGMEIMFGSMAAGSLIQGAASQSAGKYNQALAREQAKVEEASGLERQRLMQRQAGRLRGATVAAAARSGAQMSGSVLDVIADSESSLARDLATEKLMTRMRAAGIRSQGDMARVEGNNAMTAGMAGALGYGTAALL